jgi:hypothetical protein
MAVELSIRGGIVFTLSLYRLSYRLGNRAGFPPVQPEPVSPGVLPLK